MKKYEKLKNYVAGWFAGRRTDDSPNLFRAQQDAASLRSTLDTTGWAKLSERLSDSFVLGLSEIFQRLRDGNYDSNKMLVQVGILLGRLELINTIDLILKDGEVASEELKKQAAQPASIEEYASQT